MQNEFEPTRSGTCAVAVVAKASAPGRTKTRLVPPLTLSGAAELNTAFLQDVAANIVAASALANIRGFMAFAPAGTEDFFRQIAGNEIGLIETVAPTFGECLFHGAVTLLNAGHGSVCLLNSDSPTLPIACLVAASAVLAAAGDRMVLGPSNDGGYYLIGIKAPHRRLFQDIDWSTERVARQTRARAAEIDLPICELPTWYDVDDEVSLRILMRELFDGEPFEIYGSKPTSAAHTRKQLATLLANSDLRQRLDAAAMSSSAA